MTVYRKSENVFVAEIPDSTNYTSGTSPAPKDDASSSDTPGGNRQHVITPEEEYLYWENNYASRDYVDHTLDYKSTYGPAYLYGAQTFYEQEGKPFEHIDESALSKGWESFKDKSELTWERAKKAVQDAYNRLFTHTHESTGK